MTSLTFTSSRMMSVKSARRAEDGSATVRLCSGNRLRSLFALRSEEDAEQTLRTSSMAATRPASAGNSSASGQSVRCTERPPVRPRQMTSVDIGRSGALMRQRVSSTVYSVLKASGNSPSPAQKRSRERRTYQLVSASQNCRISSVAAAMFVASSDSVTSATVSCSLARM